MGAAGGDDGGLRPVPGIGPVARALMQHVVVFLRPADPGGLHPHRGGEIGRAHKANEYILVEELAACEAMIAALGARCAA